MNKSAPVMDVFTAKAQTEDIPYLKMIAFDLNKEKANKVAAAWYGIESKNAYSILYAKVRGFFHSRGFEKIQGSVYKNNTPITKSDAEKVLADLKKTFPWISYCMQNCNVSDIRISYDVTKAISGNRKEQAIFESSVVEYRNNATRKVINFDLVNTKNIPNYSNATHFKLIPGFAKKGYEHTQQTGYVSKDTKTTLQCYMDFKKVVETAPQIKPHMKNATITEIVQQYDGKDFMKLSIKDIAKNTNQIDYSFYGSRVKEENERRIYENFIRRMTIYYRLLGKDVKRIRKDIDSFLEAYDYKTETIRIGLDNKRNVSDEIHYTFLDAMESKAPPSSRFSQNKKKEEEKER